MSQAVADHLRRALDLLRRDGWCQGSRANGSKSCATWAIAVAGNEGWTDRAAMNALRDVIGNTIPAWNDAPGRKFEQVEAAFLEAIERERAT